MKSAVVQALKELLSTTEDEHLEFKAARNDLDKDTVVKYCAALANEGGGKLILGVKNEKNSDGHRQIVGTRAYQDEKFQQIKNYLVEQLRLRIEVQEVDTPEGRVLIFECPSRPMGVPIQYQKVFWMRAGESLTGMTPDHLRRIMEEAVPDYSQEICSNASLSDLDPALIERFRQLWVKKSNNQALQILSSEQLLHDAELMVDGKLTYASLILLGTHTGLGKHLAQAELVFEYRSDPSRIEYQARREFRQGFLAFFDTVWDLINARNDVQSLQAGLFVWQIPTFNERVIREALLNALVHRDYRLPGSVFVRLSPHLLEIVNPGGFPQGVSPDNILEKQSPRNRRLAEATYKCGLVERSGQGADLMFRYCLEESKPLPSYEGSDEYEVRLTLNGQIQDESFLRYLDKVRQDLQISPGLYDLIVLHRVKQSQPIPEKLRPYLDRMVEQGLIERIGRGKGAKHILSKDYYSLIGQKGTYTRKIGLDRETNKQLLLKHIRQNPETGSPISELQQVLKELHRNTIQQLLRELQDEGLVKLEGEKRGSRWFPAKGEA